MIDKQIVGPVKYHTFYKRQRITCLFGRVKVGSLSQSLRRGVIIFI